MERNRIQLSRCSSGLSCTSKAEEDNSLLPDARGNAYCTIQWRPVRSALSGWSLTVMAFLFLVLVAGVAVYLNSDRSTPFRRRPPELDRRDSFYLVGSKIEERNQTVGLLFPSTLELTRKPRSDPRTYQFATLPNGVKVVNVLDQSAVKAAFAVSVQAGSFWDPVSLPGLAHFCERMVFLGTKKYPHPAEFDALISEHGGMVNAFTASEATVYYAEIKPDAAAAAFDRLADLFRAPLFRKTFIEKEARAIDSEHAQNVQNPSRRVIEVLNSLADPRSPVSRFHTGTIETLLKQPEANSMSPADALKAFFEQAYCPSRMSVVTYGPANLQDQLRDAATQFGSIQRESEACLGPMPTFGDPEPFPPERAAKWVAIKGTQPKAELWIQFQLPNLLKAYRSNPVVYIEHVFSYSGVNSFTRVLQDNLGLISKYRRSFDMNSAGTVFYHVFTLTPQGVEHVEFLLDVFYSYVATLRQSEVDIDLYQTLADKAQLMWDWQELAGPIDTVSSVAERMTRLPPESLLDGDSLVDEPNPAFVAELIRELTPERMIAAFVSPPDRNDTNSFDNGDQVHVLPHYNVEYTVRNLSSKLPGAKERWEAWLGMNGTTIGASRMKIELAKRLRSTRLKARSMPRPVPPKPIKEIPSLLNLDHMKALPGNPQDDGITGAFFGVQPLPIAYDEGFGEGMAEAAEERALQMVSAAEAVVEHLEEAMGYRNASALASTSLEIRSPALWYRSGWVTVSPYVDVQLTLRPLRTPDESEGSAFDRGRLGIFSRLLDEKLAPKIADLSDAGATYDISIDYNQLSFSFNTFAPLLPRLVNIVLEEFNSFNLQRSRTSIEHFERIVAGVRKHLATYEMMPVSYALKDREVLLEHGTYARSELLAGLENVTLDSVMSAVGDILLSRPLQLTALVMGNMPQDEARKVVRNIAEGIRRPACLSSSCAKNQHTKGDGQAEIVTPVIRMSQPTEIRSPNPRVGDPNDVTVVTVMAGVSSVKQRVIFDLLGRMLSAVAYDELRTKRQLGYVVNAGTSRISNVQHVSALVQGSYLNADELEGAIELVLTKLMPAHLENLTEATLRSYKTALREAIVQPPLIPADEVEKFWGPIRKCGHCFEVGDEILEYLQSSELTKQLLIKSWADLMTPGSGQRKKLVIKYFAGSVPSRPSAAKVNASWSHLGIDGGVMRMLVREHKHTLLFNRTDSFVRAELSKQGGTYPQDLHCRRKSLRQSFNFPFDSDANRTMVMRRILSAPFLNEHKE